LIKTIVKLAAFVAVCTVFTLYLAFTIGNIHLFEHTYKLSATFDDVTGLLPNDNVKVAGVPVGKVRGIKIVDGRARVTFTVRTDVKLPSDSEAAVRWRNLLGQRYVYVYPGTASTMLEKGEAVRRTKSVVELGELFNRLGPIVEAIDPAKVNQFLDTIVAALDGNEAKVQEALRDLATLTKGLATRDEAIGRLIVNVNDVTGAINSRDAEIRTVLDNLVAVSTTFNQNTDVLDQAVTQLGDFSNNFGKLLADNRVHIDGIVTNLATLMDLVRSKLPTLDSALANLDDASRALFNSSRYGQWLNQTIPCGAVTSPDGARHDVNQACLLHGPSAQTGTAPTGTAGAAGLTQLFGQVVGGR
jgi:phospholipid/cholesterol/gamma-HCH transport system substrate-binding protein